jgi:uncharacterized membrane protein YccC
VTDTPLNSDGASGFGAELAGRLRRGWPDALRMVLAAVGSFALSQALRLPEAFWAVLTALVAARPHAAGTARAGIDRLVGTIAGAAVATAFALTHLHLTQLELLFAVLVPLCLLVAVHENYRAAPVAALIVLSGGMIGHSPLGTALYRTSEIAVGALVAFMVSALVLPRRAHHKAFDHAAAATKLLSCLIGPALVPQEGGETFTDRVKEKLRAELRQLGVLTHTSRWKRTTTTGVAKLTRLLSALNADIGFIERTVIRPPVQEEAAAFAAPLREIAAAFERLLSEAARAFVGEAAPPRMDVIERAISALEIPAELGTLAPDSAAVAGEPLAGVAAGGNAAATSPQHLLFLLRTLGEDCRKLCLLLAAANRAA